MKSNVKTYTVIFFTIFLFINILSLSLVKNQGYRHNFTEKSSLENDDAPQISEYWSLNFIHIDNNWSSFLGEDWCKLESGYFILENITLDAEGSGRGIVIENSEDPFIIRNCTVLNSGTNANDAAILLNNTKNGMIINNTIKENRNGIWLDNLCSNNTIERNFVANNTYSGISLRNGCEQNNLLQNTIQNEEYGRGFYVYGCSNNNFSQNQISDCNMGVYTVAQYRNNDNNSYVGNSISGCLYGFYSQPYNPWDFNNMIFSENIMEENSWCLVGDRQNDAIIVGNHFLSNPSKGIQLTQSSNCSISHNKITNSFSHGIYIAYSEYINIYKNNVSEIGANGIIAAYSNNCSIENNVIKNNTNYGMYITECRESNITLNTLTDNGDGGIYMMQFCEEIRISNNNISYNDLYGLYITESNEIYVLENKITFNGYCGILVNGSVSIIQNIIWENSNDEFERQIIIKEDGSVILLKNTIGTEMDSDSDGLTDYEEITQYGTNHRKLDTDDDNLNDAFEVKYGTDPLVDDTDGDGYYDGVEVAAGTDPLDPKDHPGKEAEDDEGSGEQFVEPNPFGIYVIGGFMLSLAAIITFGVLHLRKKKKSRV